MVFPDAREAGPPVAYETPLMLGADLWVGTLRFQRRQPNGNPLRELDICIHLLRRPLSFTTCHLKQSSLVKNRPVVPMDVTTFGYFSDLTLNPDPKKIEQLF